mmetsp:Transcript_39836/g.76153  ORF Transcript_39836/g.76153 Transcript_39836/m.76153 type:complete len:219 (-) Transcript_39836:106-762(-)
MACCNHGNSTHLSSCFCLTRNRDQVPAVKCIASTHQEAHITSCTLHSRTRLCRQAPAVASCGVARARIQPPTHTYAPSSCSCHRHRPARAPCAAATCYAHLPARRRRSTAARHQHITTQVQHCFASQRRTALQHQIPTRPSSQRLCAAAQPTHHPHLPARTTSCGRLAACQGSRSASACVASACSHIHCPARALCGIACHQLDHTRCTCCGCPSAALQ